MRSFLFISLFSAVVFAESREEKNLKIQQAELNLLKQYVEGARDSLSVEIAERYTFKQRTVDQREADKQEMDRVRENEERASNDLTRIKEECLAREQSLDGERKTAEAAEEEWKFILASLSDLFQKDADGILEAFPADREIRRAALEKVRNGFTASRDPGRAWDSYVSYLSLDIKRGRELALMKGELMSDQGGVVQLTLARFGNVFGLGVDTEGKAYIVRQTGRLGAERYAVEPVGSPELAGFITGVFSNWSAAGKPSGAVLCDIMQNDQSRVLVSGKETSSWSEWLDAIKQGGAIMIPMLLLPIWVLVLTLWKLIQIFSHRRRSARQYKIVMDHLEKNDLDGALRFSKNQPGVMARVLETCLNRKEHGRHSSERAVREMIMQEVPLLGRGINTLAVIAGAAPLMGLLGTISGMITLFSAVTHYGTGDPKFLAGGISEALITAKTGLAIAIPTLFIHDFIRNSRDRLLSEMERLSIASMNRIWPEE